MFPARLGWLDGIFKAKLNTNAMAICPQVPLSPESDCIVANTQDHASQGWILRKQNQNVHDDSNLNLMCKEAAHVKSNHPTKQLPIGNTQVLKSMALKNQMTLIVKGTHVTAMAYPLCTGQARHATPAPYHYPKNVASQLESYKIVGPLVSQTQRQITKAIIIT